MDMTVEELFMCTDITWFK